MPLIPLLAPEAAVDSDQGDAGRRVDARSNLFVVAALSCDGAAGPVRVRNMSRSGALIDGSAIPPEGSKVRLSRGSLSVAGEIVWRKENRAGVRFDSQVAVAQWLPGGKGGSGQQRIDEIVYDYKMHARATVEAAPTTAAAEPDIAREMLELARVLRVAADELAGDAVAAERHPTALQTVDVTAQKLEGIARRLR